MPAQADRDLPKWVASLAPASAAFAATSRGAGEVKRCNSPVPAIRPLGKESRVSREFRCSADRTYPFNRLGASVF